jgi:hypothetical protein
MASPTPVPASPELTWQRHPRAGRRTVGQPQAVGEQLAARMRPVGPAGAHVATRLDHDPPWSAMNRRTAAPTLGPWSR